MWHDSGRGKNLNDSPAKFGEKYAARISDIEFPTSEELLIYCKKNYHNINLCVEIKEYAEKNCNLTETLLKEYGFSTPATFTRST